MKSSIKNVALIDYLRGIAILAVLLIHTVITIFGYDGLPWKGWLRDFSAPFPFYCFLPFGVGNVGVPIFFVVSGFCIHMSFQQQGRRWGGFFIRRVFRIYPAYLAALIFSALLIYIKHFWLNFQSAEVWGQLLTHLFLIHNFSPSAIMAINAPFWSLAIEAQLYLLYPALLFLVAKLGWRRTMIGLAGCELLIRGTDGLIQTIGATNTTGGNIAWWFASSPLGFWFSWALGAFIADAFLHNQPMPMAKTSPAWWLALAIISYFVKPLFPFQFLLFALMTAVIVTRLLNRSGPGILPSSWPLNLLRKIGLWSYSIYLLHQPLMLSYSCLMPAEDRSLPLRFMLALVTWLIVAQFSFLWYKLIELPGIALGKRLIQKTDTRFTARLELEKTPADTPASTGKFRYCLMVGLCLVLVIASVLVNLDLIPPVPAENNNLAWSLATDPDATHRNGTLAVRLAEDACQRTHYKVTIMVGTLAAAYAEAGRFDEAILTARRACVLAEKNGETNLSQRNQDLLASYLNHQPYRDRQAKARK